MMPYQYLESDPPNWLGVVDYPAAAKSTLLIAVTFAQMALHLPWLAMGLNPTVIMIPNEQREGRRVKFPTPHAQFVINCGEWFDGNYLVEAGYRSESETMCVDGMLAMTPLRRYRLPFYAVSPGIRHNL